ncbi:hypothetical protein Hanom_Chr07g00628381 [Helianthus anomalus]
MTQNYLNRNPNNAFRSQIFKTNVITKNYADQVEGTIIMLNMDVINTSIKHENDSFNYQDEEIMEPSFTGQLIEGRFARVCT